MKMEKKALELTRTIAQFIVKTDESDIPSIVYEHAKIAFLDRLAVSIAGMDEPLV